MILFGEAKIMLAFAVLIITTIPLAVALHKEMERMIERSTFKPLHRSDPKYKHSVIISIPKLNLDTLEHMLEERATFGSATFMQWLSYDEISSYVMNENSYNAVKQWIDANQLTISWISRRKDYIRVEGSISQWEELLQAEFYAYLDESLPEKESSLRYNDFFEKNSHRIFHRSKSYSIPEEYQQHISAIFNTVQTPPHFNKKYRMNRPHPEHGTPFRSNFRMELPDTIASDGSTSSNGVVTVSFLNSYYDITTNIALANHNFSQAVFETGNTYFSPDDLSQFQTAYCLPQQPAVSVGAHTIQSCPTSPPTSAPDCYEGNLDIQYIMGLSQQSVSIFWWVTEGTVGTSTDPFLVWITAVADDPNPPKVNSISYGIPEKDEAASVMSQFNTEAMLLGLHGVTITVSSGDNGAPDSNSFGICNCNVNSASSTLPWANQITQGWTGKGYFPSFPATSPYVTAVGATQGPEVGSAEIACQSQEGGIITTGGGFSSFFAASNWQKSAISKYFATSSAQGIQLNQGFNQNGRGYPDVSLIGVQYQVVINGAIQSVFGTSCSSPVFAAMVSLINSQRALQNQSTLGFLNPNLWSYGYNSTWLDPSAYITTSFNDITNGDNKCCASQLATAAICCSSGFTAVTGWDPLTGWGSVQFTSLARMFEVNEIASIPLNTSTTIICNHSKSNGLLSTGAVAAVVVVSLLVIGACLGLLICCVCGGSSCGTGSSSSSTNNVPLSEQEVVAATPVVYINNPVVITSPSRPQ